jgi:hypothetical protein
MNSVFVRRAVPRLVGIGIVALLGLLIIFKPLGGATLVTGAYAQTSQVRQFAVTIKNRKVTSGPTLIRVTQGDSVEIVLTADEGAELHLHGYDVLLQLEPNVPGKLAFDANIGGRFPLEAHRYGKSEQVMNRHGAGPLLYLEVHPR